MANDEIVNAIRSFCEKLRKELPAEERAVGWTDEKRQDVLRYFEKLEHDLNSGVDIPYIPFVRTMDSAGISEGELLEEACRITNEINAKN